MARAATKAQRHNLFDDPEALVDLCEKLGWEVRKSNVGWKVDNRNGGTAPIPMQMMGRSKTATHLALRRIGIDAALDAYYEEKEAQRREKMEKERAAMDRRLALIQDQQAKAADANPEAAVNGRPADGILYLGEGDNAPYLMRVLVTPGLAMEWLTRPLPYLADGKQLQQRNTDYRFVRELQDAIRNREWLETHQGFALASEKDNTGGVADGKHRLTAIAEMEDELYPGSPLGEGVWVRVTFQEDPAKFPAYDVGRRRNSAQMHQIDGKKNTAQLSSALKMLVTWGIRAALPPDQPHVLDKWTGWAGVAARVRFPQEQAAARVWANETVDGVWYPDVEECLRMVNPLSIKPVSGNRAGLAVFLAVSLSAWPDGEADLTDFVRVVATGLTSRSDDVLTRGDPRVTLRNWLLASRYKKEWPGQGREVTLYTALTMWAAFNQGREVKNVRIMDDYEMPYAYKPKPPTPED